jgi:hypothetical protein
MFYHLQALLARNCFFGRCSSAGIEADSSLGLVSGVTSQSQRMVQNEELESGRMSWRSAAHKVFI